jgi:hypothetical protein
MKRLLILAATSLALFAAAPSSALAANSTCTTHNLDFVSWSIQTDTVNTAWHFQCGGANNEGYNVLLLLQWKDSSGAWHTFDCANGGACAVNRPLTGFYAGGSDHSGTNTWNLAGQLDCATIRFRGVVVFAGSSPTIAYNSLTVPDIGGC